jgi:hypothetical protein
MAKLSARSGLVGCWNTTGGVFMIPEFTGYYQISLENSSFRINLFSELFVPGFPIEVVKEMKFIRIELMDMIRNAHAVLPPESATTS